MFSVTKEKLMAKKQQQSTPPENPLSPPRPLEGETAVLVTTEHRGVFFGYYKNGTPMDPIALRRMRNCISWVAEQHGFIGLATKGPLPGTKVGSAADCIGLYKITSVVVTSPEAIAAWEDERPW